MEIESLQSRGEEVIRNAVDFLEGALPSHAGGGSMERHEEAAEIIRQFLEGVEDPMPLLPGIAGLLRIKNDKIRETILSALLRAFDRWRGDDDMVRKAIDAIKKQNREDPAVMEFAENLLKAHELIMNEAYRKVLRSTSMEYLSDGTKARCPQCGSPDVYSPGGMYEFTEMKCDACGYSDYCDDYQLEEWYPEGRS